MKVQERRRRDRGPKGRPLDDSALAEIQALLGTRPRRRDLLIEFLHLIQDKYRCLSARHLRALAEEMRLARRKSTRSPRSTIISTWSRKASRNRRHSPSGCAIRSAACWRARRSFWPSWPAASIPPPCASCARPASAAAPGRRPPASATAKSINATSDGAAGAGAGRRHQGRGAGLHRARGLPGGGRLSASAQGARRRDRSRCAHRHDAGCRAARPGRRRLSGRQEMGDRPHLSRRPPDVDQRRRRRARHLQGPHLSRARSAPHLRGRADRRARRRGRAHLFLHARRISRGARHPAHARSPRSRPPASPSRASSSCGAAPAPISAARKARCWRASKASAACRAIGRPISPRSGCSAARRSITMSRRCGGCATSSRRARNGSPTSASPAIPAYGRGRSPAGSRTPASSWRRPGSPSAS